MQTIKIESKTEYFAKKRVIQEAFRFFKNNPGEKEVEISSTAMESDEDPTQQVTHVLPLTKEKFLQAIDYKSMEKDWESIVNDPMLGLKPIVLYIFDRL